MEKFVRAYKNDLEKSISFLGNDKKKDRELWVLKEFLSYIKSDFDIHKLKSSNDEPIDVCYGEYEFQIKEVLSKGRKRSKEYRNKAESLKETTQVKDLLEPYSPIAPIPLNDSLNYLTSELKRHRKKYANQASEINILVYLNLTDTTYTPDYVDLNSNDEFNFWESVSAVTNNCAITLACRDTKNKLLSLIIGKLYNKNS